MFTLPIRRAVSAIQLFYRTQGIDDPDYPDLSPQADIKGMPWTRTVQDGWTTPAFRALVFAFIEDFFAAHAAWVRRWAVREIAHTPGDPMPRLYPSMLRVTVARTDAKSFEACETFTYEEMSDHELSRLKLDRIGALLYQQHLDNP